MSQRKSSGRGVTAPQFKMWDKCEIIWEDSYHTGGWSPLSNVDMQTEESLEQMTVGYFVGESKNTLSFAQSAKANEKLRTSPDTYIDAVLTIPKHSIIRISRLPGFSTPLFPQKREEPEGGVRNG